MITMYGLFIHCLWKHQLQLIDITQTRSRKCTLPSPEQVVLFLKQHLQPPLLLDRATLYRYVVSYIIINTQNNSVIVENISENAGQK